MDTVAPCCDTRLRRARAAASAPNTRISSARTRAPRSPRCWRSSRASHLYVGDAHRALGFFAAAGGLEFLGFDLDLTAVGAVVGVPMEVGGVGLWLYSIVDAYRAAHRHNRELA